MNTDAFTTAARTEAGALYAVDWDTPAYYDGEDRREAEQFLAGAEWARDHLAAQEPTDAEVEAAALGVLAYLQGYDLANEEDRTEVLAWWNRMGEEARNSRLATARAALTAARKARA
ncbi:MAG: hypothetical protein ACTH6N_14510 [Brachybacterium tyrofermentans]|uniref:hypothetical protein n=1 Tax=Brachybacterium tyrofermentans TaxID=47848 RepID=UPI001866741F|nr:hypothetical protein [Brachybacterium tyrofermentans]